MNKIAVLFLAALSGLSTGAGAFDDDPRILGDGSWYGGRRIMPRTNAPLYYRPTQRYYGAGYTVSYRYVPVFQYESVSSYSVTGSSNFRTEAFRLSTDEIPSWGANPPRLTVKDPKSAASRTAVTSIVRKKTTTKTTQTPVIIPSEPVSIPVSTEAPANP